MSTIKHKHYEKINLSWLAISCIATFSFLHKEDEKELINKTSDAEKKAKDTTNMGWKRAGNFVFLFNQSAFNNDWRGGGTSNMAGNIGLNYDFNYKTPEMIWDNKFISSLWFKQIKRKRNYKV